MHDATSNLDSANVDQNEPTVDEADDRAKLLLLAQRRAGIDISAAIVGLRTTPHMLFFPSLFLSLAVLGFILLGDAVRDALDPKNR